MPYFGTAFHLVLRNHDTLRRAGDGARTRDIKLGRLALYQLSYSRGAALLLCSRDCRCSSGGGRIRTFEGLRRQIYSLIPLAAWVPHPCFPHDRADGENRTRNRLITNQVLCQLSYVSRRPILRETRRISDP